MRTLKTLIGLFFSAAIAALPVQGAEVAKADLQIVGVALEVDTTSPVATGIDIPAVVQTIFGGKTNDAAPPAQGMSALAELTGPGLESPITVSTVPGHTFVLPPLHQTGEYMLQNIRLAGPDGGFLQQASPAFVPVTVSDILKTSVTVHQLTPDELRARGITIDERNYDVYEYTFLFGIREQFVQVPYAVAIDKRTHEQIEMPKKDPYTIPTPRQPGPPPRFQPPAVYTGNLEDAPIGPPIPPPSGAGDGGDPPKRKPVIPAAIVIPTGFGVLHQFFAVILNVSNNAPAGSSIQLDSISATLSSPLAMRVVKSNPSVALGQAVPVHDKATGATFLIAQAEGSADWSLEALKPGTHTVTLNVKATYKNPGQTDVAMSGKLSATIAVSDPRFQVNFVHPDVVRANERYTAYAFITNTSPQSQTVRLDTTDIPACGSGFSGNNVCRTEGDGITNLTLAPGEMKAVPYKLTSKITGRIFAAAANADDPITVGVQLTMGVSSSGIPLSPATLLLPYYARYVNQDYVNAQLGILGLGYSLATAPANRAVNFPRVIQNDVFRRAQDIARAGERIFVSRHDPDADDAAEDREPVFQLSLDQLSNIERVDQIPNSVDLAEWDSLRRSEEDGHQAAAAMARELERVGLAGGKTAAQFADDFAAATSHRSGYFLALVHGAPVSGNNRPYAITLNGSKTQLAVPNEGASGWIRTMPFAELDTFNVTGEAAELAMVGRWSENLELQVASASSSYTVELIYPDTNEGTFLRTSFVVSNASATTPMKVTIARGAKVLTVIGALASPVVSTVAPTPLRIVAAAQDLFLDSAGHTVSVYYNRPVNGANAAGLRDLISLNTKVPAANYDVTRKNTPSVPNSAVFVPGTALSDDARLLNITFDKTLSRNAQYTIGIDPLFDLLNPATSFSTSTLVPRIDNNAPGGIIYGKVLRGDNTEIPDVLVKLTGGALPATASAPLPTGTQYDHATSHGDYLFEFVPRDIDRSVTGAFRMDVTAEGKLARVDGTVRLPGEAQRINIVFLGRGSVKGRVTYSDGTIAANANVTIGNTQYNTLVQEFRGGVTDSAGYYNINDVPVGPLTIAAQDADGNVVYAANQIKVPGEVLTQDLVFQKKDFLGLASVRVTVRRSDITDPSKSVVPNAHVGVYTQGYGLLDGFTDQNGQFTFTRVPAGFISILAAEFSITRESAGIELDLKPDTTIDQVITLHVPTAAEQAGLVTVEGTVWRDDPASPSDTGRDVRVKNAVVTIGRFASVTADDQGNYSYPGVPTSLSDQSVVNVYDPETGRRGTFALPTLQPGVNQLKLRLSTTVPQGFATLRVRLLDAQGNPVTGYRVIDPGFPPDEFEDRGNGIYTREHVPVPAFADAWAIGIKHPKYGDQVTHGQVHADFNGQIATVELRLPGQGTIVGKLEVRKPCPLPPAPCVEQWDPAFGPMAITYPIWSEEEQQMMPKERITEADPVSGLTTITKVPVGYMVPIETVDHPAGFAQGQLQLAYDGELKPITLRLSSLGDVTGRVLSFDGQTPVVGARVTLYNSAAVFQPVVTGPDGTFKFAAVAANASFTAVAEVTQDGVYRTGYIDGRTPQAGGPVGGLVILMRQQARIEGTVVDLNGNPVPLAQYWVHELAWPHRSFGSALDPLSADKNGHFVLSNLFVGGFRVSAKSPTNQELRGDAQGEIKFENDNQTSVVVPIGGAGAGSVSVTVIDSNTSFSRVPNAEVTLMRGGTAFDFATTDANGSAFFDGVPAGTYTVFSTAKAVARTGSSDSFTVVRDAISPVQVTLTFLGKVTGTLTDPENNPPTAVRGAPVALTSGLLRTQASTGGVGDFQFIGVPEGHFQLEAYEVDTGRRAFSNDDTNFVSKLFPERNVNLTLEKMATLNVKAYLPNDAGGPGVLAPLVNVRVRQSGEKYSRELQGNDLNFPRMFQGDGYGVVVTEMGGEERVVTTGGSFAPNTYTGSVVVVFQTSGSVQVKVTADDPTLINGAQISISGNGKNATLFSDATGIVSATGFPLGNINVQVTSSNLSAAASGVLASHSTPLVLEVKLGSRAAIDGYVEAEEGVGQPSVGTRVFVDVSSNVSSGIHLETRTDATGHWHFNGIPVGNTNVSIHAFGPDDVTVGGSAFAHIPDGSTGTVPMPSIKLDATPPRVVSIDPANNANSVSPNAQVVIGFSEPIAAGDLNGGNFLLLATDDSSTVPTTITSATVNGQFQVRLTPPSLLKSNVVYALTVSNNVHDLTGNKMKTTVGAIFTTVNYTEPKIVRVDPPVELPLPEQSTFRFKFNKPIALSSFDAGNGGTVVVQQLDTYKGQPINDVSVTKYLDPVDPSRLIVAPAGVAIQQSSFYRITIGGVRDTQTPYNTQKEPQTFDWFSFDLVKPAVTIKSPVPDTFPLISGVHYTATATITDEGTTNPAKDVAWVDWFDTDGTHDTFRARVKVPPFSYDFTAPAGTSYTLKASATDLSGNTGPLSSFTWQIKSNDAPKNVAVVNTPSSVYLAGTFGSEVSFDDEGLVASIALQVTGKKSDGTPYPLPASSIHPSVNQQVSRATVDAAWPKPKYTVDVPADAKEGEPLVVTATVTDSVNQSSSATANVDLQTDSVNPSIASLTPAPETHYKFNDTFTITLTGTDAESGISHVTFAYDNQSVDVKFGTTGTSYNSTTKVFTFSAPLVRVPAKNNDTRIHIVATVYDYHGNIATRTNDVIYEGVNDLTIPKAAWISPLDGAALPAATSNFAVKLRVKATDDFPSSLKVVFTGPELANSPVTATNIGNNVFEAAAALNTPAAGSSMTLTATISDDNPTHDVILPIGIDAVAVDQTIPDKLSITSGTASQYTGKTIVVKGSAALLYITTPVTLKNLIVLDGGRVSNPDRVKLDLTVTDRLYIDAFSAIDLTAKGYLGAWQRSEDLSFTNSSPRGMGPGGVTSTGPLSSAASHAGLGASDGPLNPTNAAYGLITDPTDFGAGGGGSTACCVIGANGGGAAALHAQTAKVVLAGTITADGGQGLCGSPCIYGPGAGGSISLTAKSLITGPSSRITANGGDDNAFANTAAGAGGGRVAVRITDRLDTDTTVPVFQARGGRNGAAQEGINYTDGGAGTVFLLKPGATSGQLIVSAFDERFPATSTHLTRGTPLSGNLTFDSIVVGSRALARFDNAYTVPTPADFTVDNSAMALMPNEQPTLTLSTNPPGGSSLSQGSSLVVTYNADARDGIEFVRLPFTGAASETFDETRTYPSTINGKQTTLTVAPAATLGAATLSPHAETRSGRTVDVAALNYTIVTNTAPVIDQFDVTPASLQMYAGHDIGITAAATDDISVSAFSLTASAGALTSSTFTAAPHVTRTFTVAIPVTTPSGTAVQLTLSASDTFAGHTPTTQTKSVTILHDANAPSVTVTLPTAGATFDEGAGRTFTVEATVIDAEVGVKRVYATLDSKTYDLAPAAGRPNVYTANVPVPNVDGTDLVPKQVTVTALDYEDNSQTSPAVTINIRPLNDPNAPAVAWTCGNSGAMYPPGEPAKLRIFAKGNTSANGVQSVTFAFGDPATIVTATPVSGVADNYEASFTVPSVPDGTVIDVRATATSVGGNSADVATSFKVYAGTVLKIDTTLPASDTHLDNTTLYIRTATLTVSGHHTFNRLIVLDGGKIQHAATAATASFSDVVDVQANAMFIACNGSIDTTGKGYLNTKTYPGASGPGNGSGGSHIGIGGLWDPPLASTYGSVVRPQEAGGGGDYVTGLSGGGVIRVNAASIALDGAIKAEGTTLLQNESRGAGGGSIWITTTTATGNGTVSANGSTAHYGSGGGGAVAIEYSSGSIPWIVTAKAGTSEFGTAKAGGAGTIYTRGPQSTFGDLLVDNAGVITQGTSLPSFGKGLTLAGSAGATLVTDRTSDVPAYFVGHWIEVTAPNGTLKGTWKVATISAKTVTLAPNFSGDTIGVAVGDTWQGVYRFDNLTTPTGARILGNDPIRLGVNGNVVLNGPTGSFTMDLPYPVSGTDVAIGGNVLLGGAITATNSATINSGRVTATAMTAPTLRVKSGGTLTNPAAAQGAPFNVNVSGTITVESNGSIDVSGHGYPLNTAYPGTSPLPGNGTGGSHIGIGGLWDPPLAASFGSVTRPQEAGGGGDYTTGLTGGGVLRIIANAIALDGSIKAEGTNLTQNETRGGGGGSIWITTSTVSGSGLVSANGSIAHYGSGGGGAVSIEYATGTSVPWTLTAKSGSSDFGTAKQGGAGTVYVRGPQSTFGDVTIDNGGVVTQGTSLPSLGKGLAQAGTTGATLVTDRSANIPAYFAGHWVEITAPDGTLKGTWKIATITNKTVTLAPNASETISVAVGDTWQGVYRFDTLNTPTGAKILGNDPIRIGVNGNVVLNGPSGNQTLDLPYAISGTDVVIGGNVLLGGAITATNTATINSGRVTATAVTAPTLRVKSGGTLTNPASAVGTPFNVTVSGTITVETNGSIDVSGHGYGLNTSYPGASLPGNGTGGSHIGTGGQWDPPTSSTFGSVTRPQEAGGGGDYTTGLNGGGVLRMTANTIALDGSIKAEGTNLTQNETRGGGGGSIWITATNLTGGGLVSANGSIAHYGSGGGGAVAIEYGSGSSVPWTVTARSGTSDFGTAKMGGAGTVYTRGPQSTFGDVVVDNNGVFGQLTRLPAFGIGIAQAGSTGATLVTDRTVDVPAYFVGHWVDITAPDGTLKGTWKIASITNKTVTLAPNASEPINIAPGDQWRGVYLFSTLKLRNANFDTADLVRLGATVDKDAASSYVPGNLGAPVIVASKIHVITTALGPAVTGDAGAIIDPDQPLTVTVTNTNSGVSKTAAVNADGSFAAPIVGVTGNIVTVKAKDSHRFPLESNPVPVGALTSDTPPVSQINRSTMTNDGNFRVRTLEKEGSLLVASGRVFAGGAGDSDKVVRFDASIPSAPTYVETLALNNNRIWDIAILNGYVYAACDDLRVVNMNVTPSQVIIPDRFADNYVISVAPVNGYVFVGTDPSVGRIQIFDITNPQTPRFVRNQDLGGGINFHKLIPLGDKYLIGLTPAGTFDVNIIDRSDINNLRIVKQVEIPQMHAMRGRLVGNLLYVTTADGAPSGIAIVDVSDPLNATLKSYTSVNDVAQGVDSLGTDVFVAAGTSGVAIVNATNPAAPSLNGLLNVSGNAWDVVLTGEYAYVAAEDTLAIVPAPTPPRITPSRVTLTRESTLARVTGAKFSVTGKPSLSITIADQTSGASFGGVSVAADGSFTGTIPAAAGDIIAITATDGASRTFGPLVLGGVPFGSSLTTVPLSTAQQNNDTTFRSRLMEVEGNNLVVTSWEGARSDKIVRFNISNPLSPVFVDTINGNNNYIWDVALKNGYAYVCEDDLRVVNMNVTPSQLIVPDRFIDNYAISVAVDDTYAFVGTDPSVGRIQILDVSNPQAPHWLRNQDMGGGVNFHKMLTLGTSYLIGITPAGNNDVWIIDRRDINNLKIAAQLAIPGIAANTARLVGNTLYVTSRTSGAGIAVVDLTDPTAPVLKSTPLTRGATQGLDAAGSTIAVGDGAAGVTFLDASNPAAPRVIGSQLTPGSAWDVRFANGALYVAHETGISVFGDVSAPPTINTAFITVTRGVSGGIVTGAKNAIAGHGPLTLTVTNRKNGASVNGVAVAADGSFTTPISGNPGDTISVTALDADNRAAGPVIVGGIPFAASVTTLPITLATANNDSTFRARLMEVEGNNVVVTSWEGARSDKILRFNISNPLVPTYVDTVNGNNNFIWDVALKNGYAYVAEDDLRVVNMNVTPSQLIFPDRFIDNYAISVAVDDTYAFVGTDPLVGRIQILDVTNPQAPHWLRNQDLGGGVNFHKLLLLGNDYLVGITPQSTNNVWIIDRRDINNLKTVAQINIPTGASTGRIVGDTLYVTGRFGTNVTIIDVSNPAVPVVKSTLNTNGGGTFGVDVAGSMIAVGDGSVGVTMIDASNPATPVIVGTQATQGNAWDIRFANGALYVIHETGLSVFADMSVPPTVTQPFVKITRTAGGAVVTGAKRSVGGQGTLTVSLTDTVTTTTTTGIAVAADGSFTATLATAAPGHTIVAQAFDSAGRGSAKTTIGQVPFGSSVVTSHVTLAMQNNDGTFRSRLMAVDGNTLVVTSWEGARSDKILRFNITDPLAPVYVDTINGNNNFIFDLAMKNGYAYVCEDDLRVINTNVTPSVLTAPDRFIDNYAVSIGIEGNTAWVATDSFSGRIQTLDLTNPAVPHWLRSQDLLSNVVFHKLIPYGTSYLIAITPYLTNDVIVIDRTDLANLKIVAQLPIAGIAANTAQLDGNLLYVTEREGPNNNVAIVDLSTPTAPVVKSVTKTRGLTFGVAGSGTVAAVGDGGPGVTILDVSNTTAPKVLGTQFVGGSVWDVVFKNNVIWCATETGIAAIQGFNTSLASVPNNVSEMAIDPSKVVLVGDGGSVVVSGVAPPHSTEVEIRNATSGAFVAHIPVARDGSFSATLAGNAGDSIVIRAGDGRGRSSAAVPAGIVVEHEH